MKFSDIELLAPAGDFEKLKFAIHYGADAVYLAGNQFGLRAFAGNFSDEELGNAIQYAHDRNVKAYITVNMYAHNKDLVGLPSYVRKLKEMNADALIVADPGIYHLIRNENLHIPIHISTQATTVNWSNVAFWSELPDVERVVLARELNLEEIKEIHRQVPSMQLEAFIHGAMCISYSGRCLLSHYMTGRDANQGACAQPCRWKYALVEEKRPGAYYPIEEDEAGTYIFNAQDLSLIQNLAQLRDVGIHSFKIEGRMKSIYYVASIVRAYRNVMHILDNEHLSVTEKQAMITDWQLELDKVSHRPYTTGFYFGTPETNGVSNSAAGYIQDYDFCGVVQSYDADTQMAIIEERNKISCGDTLEFMGRTSRFDEWTVHEMYDMDDKPINSISVAQAYFKMRVPFPVAPLDIIRRARLS